MTARPRLTRTAHERRDARQTASERKDDPHVPSRPPLSQGCHGRAINDGPFD